MDATSQSQTFFFISSVGFIIIGAIFAILLIYLIRAVNVFHRIVTKVEKDIDTIGDTTKEMLEEVKDSSVFHFLFRKKKRKQN